MTDFPDWNVSVPGMDTGEAILQSPGTYTIYTFATTGRIWGALAWHSMGCTGGSGTQFGYAKVFVSGGRTLALADTCIAGATANDAKGSFQSYPGFTVPAGTLIKLDVNNGGGITGGVNRGSGLIVVSIP